MGVYIYTLAPPSRSRKLNLLDGRRVEFLTMDWFCRAVDAVPEEGSVGALSDLRRRQCRYNALQRKYETWHRVSREELFVAIINEKPQDGDEVYRWSGDINPVWYDCDKMPGPLVGYLLKEGRSWALIPDKNPMMALAKAAQED